LSDSDFEKLLPLLAQELTTVNYIPQYSDEILLKDWNELKKWNAIGTSINSTSRIGIKLCEHFMPNFYEIENNKKESFAKYWKDISILTKVLKWNRKSHSTPYLSELKRGIYFVTKLPKSTMYRPQMSKLITRGAEYVLDPCAGWGGRMLGSVANNAHYIAFEPNKATYDNLQRMIAFLGIEHKTTIINDDALNIDNYNIPSVDIVLTSPPYFDLEVYCKESSQSITNRSTYKEWNDNFLYPLIQKFASKLKANGRSCWNVAKVGKNDMWKSVDDAHTDIGFSKTIVYENKSSARPTTKSSKKSSDMTVCYEKP
jgi:16S rRNA G966 N2-methylase RsmD